MTFKYNIPYNKTVLFINDQLILVNSEDMSYIFISSMLSAEKQYRLYISSEKIKIWGFVGDVDQLRQK